APSAPSTTALTARSEAEIRIPSSSCETVRTAKRVAGLKSASPTTDKRSGGDHDPWPRRPPRGGPSLPSVDQGTPRGGRGRRRRGGGCPPRDGHARGLRAFPDDRSDFAAA